MELTTSNWKMNFIRWANTAGNDQKELLLLAANKLVPLFEIDGFQWSNKSFEYGNVPANTIHLEREYVMDQIDFVSIIFDKYYRTRFQIAFGTKQKSSPHNWVRAGALVWKKVDESIKFKWWGAKWWNINKSKKMIDAIDAVSLLIPQIIEYLSNNVAGENVWSSSGTKQT